MPKTPTAPYVTLNVAISADGKIATRRRESFPLGSAEDRRLMDVLRARADAVVVGAGTVRSDGWAIRVRDAGLRAGRRRRRGAPHPLNVVPSARLDLSPGRQFFTHAETERLVLTTRAAPAARVRRFEKHASVIVLARKRIRPTDVLAQLSKRGVKRVLLEGGGELNYSFLEQNLVDEMYLTLTPRILGGRGAPTAVDGTGFLRASHIRLELRSCRRRDDEVFLRYRVIKR
ncbi:MAG: RibD family protein [Candidatus Krumholzibacteriia bacterium]